MVDFPPAAGDGGERPRGLRSSRNPDLDWLYRSDAAPDDGGEPTRAMTADELAGLDVPAPTRLEAVDATRLDDGTRLDDAPVHPRTPPDLIMPAPRVARPAPPIRERAAVPADAPVRTPLPSRERVAPPPHPAQLPPASRPAPAPRVRRRRHPLRRFLTTLLLLALLLAGYLVGVPAAAFGSAAKVANVPTGERPPAQPGTAILLVGSDARGKLTPEEEKDLGIEGDADSGRTDTMLILYVAPSGRAALVSLPRDSYVDIPGHGKNKLNAAFALGGAQLLTQTVEGATGLRMDGYVEVGFGGFARVVQALGGLDVCVEQPIEGEAAYPTIPAGCQRLDPKQSLWFVRARHNDPQGDIGRVSRQRQFMAAVVKELASPATVANPVRYWNVNQAVARGVGVGTDTHLNTAGDAARGMWSVSKGDGVSLVVPLAETNAETDAGSSVLWDEQCASELFGQLAKGDLTNVERYTPTGC